MYRIIGHNHYTAHIRFCTTACGSQRRALLILTTLKYSHGRKLTFPISNLLVESVRALRSFLSLRKWPAHIRFFTANCTSPRRAPPKPEDAYPGKKSLMVDGVMVCMEIGHGESVSDHYNTTGKALETIMIPSDTIRVPLETISIPLETISIPPETIILEPLQPYYNRIL